LDTDILIIEMLSVQILCCIISNVVECVFEWRLFVAAYLSWVTDMLRLS